MRGALGRCDFVECDFQYEWFGVFSNLDNIRGRHMIKYERDTDSNDDILINSKGVNIKGGKLILQ